MSGQASNGWETVAIRAGTHLLLKWPARLFAFFGRQVFDHPIPGLALVGLLLTSVTGLAVTRVGISQGRWGESVAAAWRSEEAARRDAALLRKALERHKQAFPNQTQEYPGWHDRGDALRAAIDENEALVPSWVWPLAPTQREAFDDAAQGWRLLYAVDHVLFGTVFPLLALPYLAIGAALGWRGSRRCRSRRWRLAKLRQSASQVLLGLNDAGRPEYLAQADRNRHMLLVGTTGAGKTEALKVLTRHDIDSGRGLVFIDMKGDRGLAESLFSACVQAGRRDDFLFLTMEAGEAGAPGPSHTYNALATGDALAKRDRLLSACTWSPEPFYRNESKAALGRILAALEGRGAITLENLYEALDEPKVYERIGEWAAPKDQPKFARDLDAWSEFRRNTSGLRANLHEFLQLRDRLCVPHGDIDFREVHARNRVVYFELNSQMRKEASSSLAKLVLEDLKHLSGALAAGAPSARKPFSIYVDEARNAVYEGLAGFISQCRSAGIGLVLASQSPLDFDAEQEGLSLAIAQNTATKLIFCQRDPESARFCAELGGTKNALKRTRQMVDVGFGAPAEAGVFSEREVKEFHFHPDELKELEVGRAFLIRRTTRALIEAHWRLDPVGAPSVPFAPTSPKRWEREDRKRFGLDEQPVDFGLVRSAG